MKPQSSQHGSLLITVIVILALLGGVGYFFDQLQTENKELVKKLTESEAANKTLTEAVDEKEHLIDGYLRYIQLVDTVLKENEQAKEKLQARITELERKLPKPMTRKEEPVQSTQMEDDAEARILSLWELYCAITTTCAVDLEKKEVIHVAVE